MVDLEKEISVFCKQNAPEGLMDLGTVQFLVHNRLVVEKTARVMLIRNEYMNSLKVGVPITEIIEELAEKYNCGTVTIRNYLKVRKLK